MTLAHMCAAVLQAVCGMMCSSMWPSRPLQQQCVIRLQQPGAADWITVPWHQSWPYAFVLLAICLLELLRSAAACTDEYNLCDVILDAHLNQQQWTVQQSIS
jgi:hypothetical protein